MISYLVQTQAHNFDPLQFRHYFVYKIKALHRRLSKCPNVNAELKFTLSADSLSSWDSIYEDDQEKLSEVPEYIKKLASKGKLKHFY